MESLKNYALVNNQRLVDDFIKKSFDVTSIEHEFFIYVKKNKSVCININLQSLDYVLQSGEYKNIFQLGYGKEEIKRRYSKNNLSNYFDKLMAFVGDFDKERLVKYGSLNTGGLGSNYPGFGNGMIAIILKDSFVDSLEEIIFCLKRFSLNYYNHKLQLWKDKFEKDICTWNKVEYLALEKHQKEIREKYKVDSNNLIANDKGWLEILNFNSIFLSAFKENRFNGEYLDYLEALQESSSDKYEQIQYLQFKSVKNSCSRKNINLIKINQ